jgi:hypothetical protein
MNHPQALKSEAASPRARRRRSTSQGSKQDWLKAAASLAGVASISVAGCSSAPDTPEPERVGTTAEPLDSPGVCGALCTGACGPNCNACNYYYRYVCEVNNSGQQTGWQRKITHFTCGTHAACRQHDACGDTCAQNAGCNWGTSTCTIGCDAQIAWQYGCISNPGLCASWASGGGPYDGTLIFEYDATQLPAGTAGADPNGRTYNPSQCPQPSAGPPPPPPPNCNWAACQVWNGSSCVCSCSGESWCNGIGECMGP